MKFIANPIYPKIVHIQMTPRGPLYILDDGSAVMRHQIDGEPAKGKSLKPIEGDRMRFEVVGDAPGCNT